MAAKIRSVVTLAILTLLGAASVVSAQVCYESEGPPADRYKHSCSLSPIKATPEQACQAIDNLGACDGLGADSSYVGIIGTAAPYTCRYRNIPGGFDFTQGTVNKVTGSCSAGYTVIDGLCKKEVPCACPAAGTDGGTQNLTVGWALSGVPGAADTVQTDWGSLYDSEICASGCKRKIKAMVASPACWRSQEPADNGMYRLSCDYNSAHTGETCTTTPDASKASPAQPKPACNGTLGTVNGKPYCASNNPGNSVKMPGPEKGGNPKAGSSPTETNAAREPTAPTGAPDARGGPGVTTRPDGSKGTGSDRTGGTTGGGTGTGETPKSEQIPPCGLPDTPKCKIDETGTPTSGNFGDATTALNDATKARQDGLATVTDPMGKNTGWTWTMALPTGCQPISLNMILKTVVFDPCAYQGVFHDLMSLLWAGATLFAVFGMVGRTLREA